MKKVLIAIPVFVISFGLLMTAIGALMPRDYAVERSMFIEGDPDEIFGYVEDLETWDEWTYWTSENIDGLEVTMGETTVGKGARKSWTENGVPGSITITEHQASEFPKSIETETQFGNYQPMVSVIEVNPTSQDITDEDGNVRKATGALVSWKSKGRVNADPMSGWFGILIPSMLGPSYDYSLSKLHDICVKAKDKETPKPNTDAPNSSDSDESEEPDSEQDNPETSTSGD